jgi:hypothetical protein
MSGSGEKRRKQVARGFAGPAPKIMTAPGFYTNCAAHHAARVAERVVNRHNSVDDGDEIDLLKEQLENIDESEDDGTSNESDLSNERGIIQHRLEVIAQDAIACTAKQATEAKAKEDCKFTCAVCLEECPRLPLRILAPCGHGFCSGCVDKLCAPSVTFPPDCPTCREPVTSVVTPFF